VRTYFEVYGEGELTILLLPTWSLVHSRFWKMQLPYLARHFRVVTFDGRGNGRSDRPQDAGAYGADALAADAIAVMDRTETETALTVSASAGTLWNLFLCSNFPDRISGAVFYGPLFPVTDEMPEWAHSRLVERRTSYDGAERYNLHFIRENLAEFAEWWAGEVLAEPHSTKGVEDVVAWALESDGQTIAHTLGPIEALGVDCMAEVFALMRPALEQMATAIRCPVLVLEGELDTITPPVWARALAECTGGELRVFSGLGHGTGRRPVPINLALREFAESLPPG
jgi:pimeloyl-ACP methyl ester carboxylesterase